MNKDLSRKETINMIKRIILCSLCLVLLLSCLKGCGNSLDFDYEAIEELVENYITSKYGIDCEMTKAYRYAKSGERYVEVWFKSLDDENQYRIRIYPESDIDSDRDGYYDSYYIESDGYFTTYIQPMVIPWINELAEQYVGFDEYLIFASLHYDGYIKDSHIPENVDEIISKGDQAGIFLYIIIPEEEYIDDDNALERINGLIEYLESTDMDCWGKLEVYDQEKYEAVSQYQTYQDYNNNIRKYFDTATIYLFK